MKFSLLVATLLLAPAALFAQQPDCNLARKAYDNPFSDSHGFTMRRYQWHASYAVAGALAGEGLYRVTGKRLPRWASFTIAGTTIKVVPHIRGIVQKRYPFNAKDWAFDAFIGAAPLIAWAGITGKDWRSKLFATTTLVGGYFALACFASP